ncbi:MAG: fibronectin type III domain-containing protein [Rubrivivax sp.]|nr:fibronectin type III domain-containing protein [Rubrivivax sp.]
MASAPEGEWRRVNLNSFSEAWTPASLRPLMGSSNPEPAAIITAWSGFAWDSRRGDLWLFGGGHANYPGNDTYRWRGQTQRWERASLPSEVVSLGLSSRPDLFQSIDGPDAAPTAAHTYDNNLYLPLADRLITFGGGAYNSGGTFVRRVGGSSFRETGPYLFDPSRADGNMVGGSTGSHVQRVAPYAEILGGNMWSNRDLAGWQPTHPFLPGAHVNGMTAYAQEDGKDVVYVVAYGNGGGTDANLYRYVINELASPALDSWQRVGMYWNGTPIEGAGALDTRRRLFVRTGDAGLPFVMWDLAQADPYNRDQVIEPSVLGEAPVWSDLRSFGMDYDPQRDAFMLWGGGAKVWQLRAPAVAGGTWVLQRLPLAAEAPVPAADFGTGVLGKWKYIASLDAFMALQGDTDGQVWLYKPFGWRDPRGGTNQYPSVNITAPADGTSVDTGTTITITAEAADADGSVAQVQFFAGSTLLGTVASAPYAWSWSDTVPGTHLLTARAVDDVGASTTSSAVSVTVRAPNQPPAVSLTSPAAGSTFTAPAAISLVASASDADGSIAQVQFFAGSTLLATDTVAPYAHSWSSVAAGSYTITARATDDRGAVTTSAPATIIVEPANQPPTVVISSPAANSTFFAPTSITINADAADADGSVTQVQFFAGSTLLGTVSTAPYGWSWADVPLGTYTLTARATDNRGAVTTSGPIAVTVRLPNQPPTVTLTSPASGTTYTAPATIGLAASAGDSDGSITRVRFYRNGTLIGTDTTAPYTFSWTNVAAGTYAVTAEATDNEGGITTSAPVTIIVNPANQAPTVALTSPSAGATFAAPATISLAAVAADADGSVAQVRFFRGSTLLATVTAPPYQWTWTPVAAGNYNLTARATDDKGAVTTSPAVSISVVNVIPAPPSSLTVLAFTSSSVSLQWSDNSNNEQGFRLQRSTNGTQFSNVATLPANTTTFTDTGRVAGRLYYYRVVAYNSAGTSAASNVVQVRTLPP